MAERRLCNPEMIVQFNQWAFILYLGVGQLVAYSVWNRDVAGSSPATQIGLTDIYRLRQT